MCDLSSSNRPISSSEASGEAGSFTAPFAGEGYQNIIEQANSISIKKIFMMYGLRLDENNRKTTCPFKSHKGGRESTASFYYYPDTNTYFCYGCRQGSKPVDFVHYMDKCTKVKAAQKILQNFSSEVEDDFFIDRQNFSERMEIMMQYSNAVRDFHINFNDESSFDFIENNCQIFDKINKKYDLNNEALKSVVQQLIDSITNYNK
jgi:hypothetical protein